MQFFGLDTLTPSIWAEREGTKSLAAVRLADQEDETALPRLQSLMSARQLLQEDKDPLGISDTVYV